MRPTRSQTLRVHATRFPYLFPPSARRQKVPTTAWSSPRSPLVLLWGGSLQEPSCKLRKKKKKVPYSPKSHSSALCSITMVDLDGSNCFLSAWTPPWLLSFTPISSCSSPPLCPPNSSTAWGSTARTSCMTSSGTRSPCGPGTCLPWWCDLLVLHRRASPKRFDVGAALQCLFPSQAGKNQPVRSSSFLPCNGEGEQCTWLLPSEQQCNGSVCFSTSPRGSANCMNAHW